MDFGDLIITERINKTFSHKPHFRTNTTLHLSFRGKVDNTSQTLFKVIIIASDYRGYIELSRF